MSPRTAPTTTSASRCRAKECSHGRHRRGRALTGGLEELKQDIFRRAADSDLLEGQERCTSLLLGCRRWALGLPGQALGLGRSVRVEGRLAYVLVSGLEPERYDLVE